MLRKLVERTTLANPAETLLLVCSKGPADNSCDHSLCTFISVVNLSTKQHYIPNTLFASWFLPGTLIFIYFVRKTKPFLGFMFVSRVEDTLRFSKTP